MYRRSESFIRCPKSLQPMRTHFAIVGAAQCYVFVVSSTPMPIPRTQEGFLNNYVLQNYCFIVPQRKLNFKVGAVNCDGGV